MRYERLNVFRSRLAKDSNTVQEESLTGLKSRIGRRKKNANEPSNERATAPPRDSLRVFSDDDAEDAERRRLAVPSSVPVPCDEGTTAVDAIPHAWLFSLRVRVQHLVQYSTVSEVLHKVRPHLRPHRLGSEVAWLIEICNARPFSLEMGGRQVD